MVMFIFFDRFAPNFGILTYLMVIFHNYQLRIDVQDSKIKYVHVSDINTIKLLGAEKNIYNTFGINERLYKLVKRIPYLNFKESKTAICYDLELHTQKPNLGLEANDVEAYVNKGR